MAIVAWTGVDPSLIRSADKVVALGTATMRAALATTTSYVVTSHVSCATARLINLKFTLVWADSTSTEWYIEWSHDATTWWRSVNYSTSGAVNTAIYNYNTYASGASAKWMDPVEPQDIYMRLYVKKTGGVGGDTLAVYATMMGGV